MRALRGCLALVALAFALRGHFFGAVAAPDAARSYVGGNFELTLDGIDAGMIQKLEGGDVVPEPQKQGTPARKARYTDMSFEIGPQLAPPLRAWLNAALARKATPANAAINMTDAAGKSVARVELTNALVTEIAFPAVDAASKDAAYLGLKFSPEIVRNKPGDGADAAAPAAQKRFHARNFRLSIDGVGVVRAAKIEPFGLKQRVGDTGTARAYDAAQLISPLVVHVAQANAASLQKWQSDTARSSGPALGKSATLEYLSDDMKTPLLTVRFDNVHLASVAPEQPERSDAVRLVRAELSLGRIRLE